MDELSLVIQSIIDSELDDLILDLVYDIHSSIKGIPEDQLELSTNNNQGNKTKQFLIPFSQTQTTAIEKQTCLCPHCGQTNIIAIRFAYHLAKCLGERKKARKYLFLISNLNQIETFKDIFKVLVDVHHDKQNIVLLIKL